MDEVWIENSTQEWEIISDSHLIEDIKFFSPDSDESITLSRVIHADSLKPLCKHLHSSREYKNYLIARSEDEPICTICNLEVHIEGKRKTPGGKEIEVDGERWTRNGVSFRTEESDLDAIPYSTLLNMFAMCGANLSRFGADTIATELFPLKMLLAKKESDNQVCGFALYQQIDVKEYETVSRLSTVVKMNGWYPSGISFGTDAEVRRKKLLYLKFITHIISLAPDPNSEQTKVEMLTRIPTLVSILGKSGNSVTLSTYVKEYVVNYYRQSISKEWDITLLKSDIIEEMALWLSQINISKIKPMDVVFREKLPCVYIQLICADNKLKSSGIAKGIMRHLAGVAKFMALESGFSQACLRLFPASDDLRLLYASMGFEDEPVNNGVEPYMRTFNILSNLRRWNPFEPIEAEHWTTFINPIGTGPPIREDRSIIPVIRETNLWTRDEKTRFYAQFTEKYTNLLEDKLKDATRTEGYPYFKLAKVTSNGDLVGVMVYSIGNLFRIQALDLVITVLENDGITPSGDVGYASLITMLCNIAIKYEIDDAPSSRDLINEESHPEHEIYSLVISILKNGLTWYEDDTQQEIGDNAESVAFGLLTIDWTANLGSNVVDSRNTHVVFIRLLQISNNTEKKEDLFMGCFRSAGRMSIDGAKNGELTDARVIIDTLDIQDGYAKWALQSYGFTSLGRGYFISENLLQHPEKLEIDDDSMKKRTKK